jgi:ABC-type uncharacterized transport system substrate-binding protein
VAHGEHRATGRQEPGDIPFEQATKLELVVNLKAAKALGLTIPTGRSR